MSSPSQRPVMRPLCRARPSFVAIMCRSPGLASGRGSHCRPGRGYDNGVLLALVGVEEGPASSSVLRLSELSRVNIRPKSLGIRPSRNELRRVGIVTARVETIVNRSDPCNRPR
jgi:hypothetical protein